jgi:hypothetical protein
VGDDAFFPCPDDRRRAGNDRPLGGHEKKVGDKHQIRRRHCWGFDIADGYASLTIGLRQGVVLMPNQL